MKKIIYSLLLILCGYVQAQNTGSAQSQVTASAQPQNSSSAQTQIAASAQSQNSDPETQSLMRQARQYLTGFLKPLDPAKAFSLYMTCAVKGNAQAMNAVGLQYNSGLGTAKDPAQALSWFAKAARAGYPKAWYNLGLMYKLGRGATQNYDSAYTCFKKAAQLQDPSGWYAKGYMLYKGLGCTQDYTQAAQLFRQGAAAGKPSCMYFLGLCFRNGYGLKADADSADHWLNAAASSGYRAAKDELRTQAPENDAAAGLLTQKVSEAQKLVPHGKLSLDTYNEVNQDVRTTEMAGAYSGYLIKYDWSGQHVIETRKLALSLEGDARGLSGTWVENDSLTLAVKATMDNRNLVFSDMQYRKTDHYSPRKSIPYRFNTGNLELTHSGDSVYLSGNITQYSPQRKEPSKPLFVVLVRKATTAKAQDPADETNITAKNLTATPNPFTGSFTLTYSLKHEAEVRLQLADMNGKVVYANQPAKLPAGDYSLPVTVSLPAGAYVVSLYYDNQVKSSIIVKQ